jgi:glutaredoxin
MMFSKTTCPFCNSAKNIFKEFKKEPGVIELNVDCKCYGIIIILILVIKY